MYGHSMVADGNIAPCRFVTLSTTSGRVTASASGEQPFGISGQDTRQTPLSGLDDGFHAIAGENCLIYGNGQMDVMLELSGTVTRGQYLKPGASAGTAIAATADQDKYGAVALQAGVSGELIKVEIRLGERSGT